MRPDVSKRLKVLGHSGVRCYLLVVLSQSSHSPFSHECSKLVLRFDVSPLSDDQLQHPVLFKEEKEECQSVSINMDDFEKGSCLLWCISERRMSSAIRFE